MAASAAIGVTPATGSSPASKDRSAGRGGLCFGVAYESICARYTTQMGET
jgi:hypothetical protein